MKQYKNTSTWTQVTSGEMSNTLCRETLHFLRLVFPKAGTLKSASLFDAVAHTNAVTQITCEGERWILRLDGSNGCKSLCR